MKQVTRSLIALGGLAVVGGGALFWAANSSSDGDDDNKPRLLVDLEEDELVAADIDVQGTRYRVELTEQGWVVDGEPPVGADPRKVSELMGTLVRGRVVEWLSPEETPSDEEMGLAGEGTVVATFHPRDGREVSLSIGRPSAFDKSVYARFARGDDAARVVLLPPGTRAQLARPPSTYFDRRPLGLAPELLQSLQITPTEPSEQRVAYRVERMEDGARWQVAEPDLGEADPFVIRQLIEGLTGTRVSSFPELSAGGKLADYGLDPPVFRVVARGKLAADENAPVVVRTLRVSAVTNPEEARVTDQTVRIARSDQPWIADVSAILLHTLPRRLDELKSKRLAWVAPDEVHRVELQLKGAGAITLERAGADPPEWRMLAPEPAEASPQRVSALLLALSTLAGVSREAEGEAARDPARLAKLGLDDDADQIRLLAEGGDVLLDLRLGHEEEGARFVTSEGSGFIARVPTKKLSSLPKKPAELFKTEGLYQP